MGYNIDVLDVFKLDKNTGYAGGHNKRLLWHGSRLTNWGGILSQGLRIAPPEAPVTGYMFGKVFVVLITAPPSKTCSKLKCSRESTLQIALPSQPIIALPHEVVQRV